MKVVVVGGGAAGFFTAVNVAEKVPHAEITILEKTSKLLSKVKVSGGGRCNVTNARTKPSDLIQFYPRGGKKLYSVFQQFGTAEMRDWLSKHGVSTHAEEDLRVFPSTNSSQTIIDCFINGAYASKIKIKTGESVKYLDKRNQYWVVVTEQNEFEADKVIFATGSSNASWKVLEPLGLEQSPLAPSLFTFNISDTRIQELPGTSFEEVNIRVVKSKLADSGAMIITHWGISGPAVLKLSAWGALEFQEKDYQFQVMINFTPAFTSDQMRSALEEIKRANPNRKVQSHAMFGLTRRFWENICNYCEISAEQLTGELNKKQINKLIEELNQGLYQVEGKSTFKDEFVTCGGIALHEIDMNTFECRKHPGLYLAGEVLNIDAITGGFNFQACWSAGWLISEHLAK